MVQKLYTKNGDNGTTLLLGGPIAKDSRLVHTIGCVDAFIASLDMCRLHLNSIDARKLERVQDTLIKLTVFLTLREDNDIVTKKDIGSLEKEIDILEKHIPAKFVRFNTPTSCHLNEARVRCRELERFLVKYVEKGIISKEVFAYVNRLSDWLFCQAFRFNT
ncbi:TPA: ATP:cob(I)alamin adenosyltransferase [Candidatus Woesearchaeota archaeon]|nr:hypothetical protein [archaeon]HIJ11287.1 ATP:cob(I)alamin adenosyltransferase [Candidatus Woesearchaeota archaeon]